MRKRTGAAIAVAAAVAASGITSALVVHRERTAPVQYASRPTRFYETTGTQRFRYQTTRSGLKLWGRAYHKVRAMRKLRSAMSPYRTGPGGQGFQLNDGDGWGLRHSLKAALYQVRRFLGRAPPRRIIRIRPVSRKPYVWRIRKVDIDPAVKADTQGTTSVDIIVGSTLKKFPRLALLGIYECRYILGTSSLSQHAYGNAVDWSGSTALMDAVAKWQYAMARKGWLPLAQLLWRGRDWFSGGAVYDHYNHIHDSGQPMMSGGCRAPGLSRVSGPVPTVTDAPLEGAENGE